MIDWAAVDAEIRAVPPGWLWLWHDGLRWSLARIRRDNDYSRAVAANYEVMLAKVVEEHAQRGLRLEPTEWAAMESFLSDNQRQALRQLGRLLLPDIEQRPQDPSQN